VDGEPGYAQEFVDVDGGRLGVQVYPEPVGTTGAPVAVIWPAMGVRARYYRPFAAELRAAGLAVVVADLRGNGASTPTPSRADRYGYAELADDVGAVLAALKPRLDGRNRLLVGHSLGGQAALLHLALHGADEVDAVALIAVGIPYWRSYPGLRGLGLLPYTQGIAATAAVLGVWPGWGFGGRQARGVMRDWAYTARTGRFPRLNGTDTEAPARLWTTSPGSARARRWRGGSPVSPATCRPAEPYRAVRRAQSSWSSGTSSPSRSTWISA
jgi:predicted alpha/beta hydrolase